ncbi:non-canonical purine NTP pyrophosphatase [Candidatus Phycosocius bacilliformis]|uniref:dITP/XTP pyrophosphatase n=1 Tax=Candidatus Phycosocius bacilliformis TaxID=1445552 RepID=A0A2P2E6L5_9PROT|nr:RdgB/HAM1 family non-canonical purine NTP pyrophosphatase [Candidatus Phycosocius bacilliformis]GBF56697.1 non-canonical purine NTP pyrophosphatase [Candidatus Phycosocius bacilliformis]
MLNSSKPFEKLVIASHNKGKLKEIAALVTPFGIDVISAGDLGVAEPEETEDSFIGNALLKARASCQATGLPALADDSGLEVMALDRAPGIYSARWAGPERDFYAAMGEIERQMQAKGATDRTARFVCALALVYPDGREAVFEGEVRGQIVAEPRGSHGFGYDPIFVADGQSLTFGELDPAIKHAMSHRADAFAKFVSAILS